MTILIIEDDASWQEIFSELVEDAGAQSELAASYQAAVKALRGAIYQAVILDVSLSGPHFDNRDGVTILREMRADLHHTPTLVVTGYATVDLAVETLVELRASNFFRKDNFDRRKFLAVLHDILHPTQAEYPPADVTSQLSEREREVFQALAQGESNPQIAERMQISINTVKKHVRNIFIKLEVNSRAAAVRRAFKD